MLRRWSLGWQESPHEMRKILWESLWRRKWRDNFRYQTYPWLHLHQIISNRHLVHRTLCWLWPGYIKTPEKQGNYVLDHCPSFCGFRRQLYWQWRAKPYDHGRELLGQRVTLRSTHTETRYCNWKNECRASQGILSYHTAILFSSRRGVGEERKWRSNRNIWSG